MFMTEIDPSLILKDGDAIYFRGVKYQKVEEQPKTIRDIIERWWLDTFTSKNKWDVDTCIDDLADQIEFWILRNKG